MQLQFGCRCIKVAFCDFVISIVLFPHSAPICRNLILFLGIRLWYLFSKEFRVRTCHVLVWCQESPHRFSVPDSPAAVSYSCTKSFLLAHLFLLSFTQHIICFHTSQPMLFFGVRFCWEILAFLRKNLPCNDRSSLCCFAGLHEAKVKDWKRTPKSEENKSQKRDLVTRT